MIAIPGGPDDGVERNADTTSSESRASGRRTSVVADGLSGERRRDVDVPSAPTAVTDAAYVPALAYTCDVVAVVVVADVPSPNFQS